MKYQVYLNKSVSEIINAIAKASNKKPNTFIKEFVEQCFNYVDDTLGEEAITKVKDYGKRKEIKD